MPPVRCKWPHAPRLLLLPRRARRGLSASWGSCGVVGVIGPKWLSQLQRGRHLALRRSAVIRRSPTVFEGRGKTKTLVVILLVLLCCSRKCVVRFWSCCKCLAACAARAASALASFLAGDYSLTLQAAAVVCQVPQAPPHFQRHTTTVHRQGTHGPAQSNGRPQLPSSSRLQLGQLHLQLLLSSATYTVIASAPLLSSSTPSHRIPQSTHTPCTCTQRTNQTKPKTTIHSHAQTHIALQSPAYERLTGQPARYSPHSTSADCLTCRGSSALAPGTATCSRDMDLRLVPKENKASRSLLIAKSFTGL